MGVCLSPAPQLSRPGAARLSHHSAGRRGRGASPGAPAPWSHFLGRMAQEPREAAGTLVRSSDRCSSEVVASPSGRRQVLLGVLRTPLAPAQQLRGYPRPLHPVPNPAPFGAPNLPPVGLLLAFSPCPCIVICKPWSVGPAYLSAVLRPRPLASRSPAGAAAFIGARSTRAAAHSCGRGSYTLTRCRRQQGI